MDNQERNRPENIDPNVGPGTQAVLDALKVVRNAESQLAASEERHRALVDAAVHGIITIDERGIVLSFNPAAERLFGFDRQEVIGQNVSMLVPPDHRDLHDSYINNYLQSGVAKIIGLGREVEGVRKDGSMFPMHLSIGEFHDDPSYPSRCRRLPSLRRLWQRVQSSPYHDRSRYRDRPRRSRGHCSRFANHR